MKKIAFVACVAAALNTAFAVDYVVSASAKNSNSYLNEAIWVPADGSSSTKIVAESSGDPASPNVYKQNGYRLNTPASGLYTFPGDRLELNGAGQNLIYRTASSGGANQGVIVNDLRVAGDTSILNWNTLPQPILGGNIFIESGKTLTFQAGNGKDDASGEARIRQFKVTANISGPGALALNSSKPSYGNNFPPMPTLLYGDNSGLTGGVTFNDGYGRFCVTNENALGSGSITFKGATLLTQTNVRFVAPGRSATLSAKNDVAPTFEVAEGTVNYFAYPIHGTSANVPLRKGGAGTLVLAAASDYAGATLVTSGTVVVLRREYASPSTTFTVSEGARLVVGGILEDMYLDVDKNGFEEQTLTVLGTGGFNVDLDGVAGGNETALIRITEAMAHDPFAVTVFNVTNAPAADATPVKLLSAPSLADFRDVDFFVDPPYAGKLSRSREGDEDVLWFTPTPKANVIFKNHSDRYTENGATVNSHANTNAFWDSGVPATAGNVYVSTNVWVMTNGEFPAPFVAYGPADFMPREVNRTSTFPDLTLLDGVTVHSWDKGATLAGHLHLAPITHGGVAYSARINHIPESSKHLNIPCEIDGYGTFEWQTPGGNYQSETFVTFSGKNTNFFGKVDIHTVNNAERGLRYRITSEEALGGNPPAFRADQLRIYNQGYLSVSNNVTLDDPNRGIIVGRDPVNTTSYTIGNLLVTNGATFTVACPIAGNSLNLKGQGTVVLANPTNTYAGGTTVYGGATLVPRGAKSLGGGLLYVLEGGTVAIPWPHDMPNGVEVGGGSNCHLQFRNGSKLTLALADGVQFDHVTTIPLLQVPNGAVGNETQQAAAAWYSSVTNFPFEFSYPGFTHELRLEGRQLSVTFRPKGFTVIFR